MTRPLNPKILWRSSRWLLPPLALLSLVVGLSDRRAYTHPPVNQRTPQSNTQPERENYPDTSYTHSPETGVHTHDHEGETLSPIDEVLLGQNGSNQVSIQVQGNKRVITANGIPTHTTGAFPNRNNPNSISAQRYVFSMPANPTVAAQVTPLRLGKFGVAINGVPFDPGAAEFWGDGRDRSGGGQRPAGGSRPQGQPSRPPSDVNVWQYEALADTSHARDLGLDQNNAHVQPTGAYHYHGLPTGLLRRLSQNPRLVLLGYAADGFPIYGPYGYNDANNANSGVKPIRSSYRLKSGSRPSDGPPGSYDGTFVQDYEYVAGAGDLDECNGRVGVTPEYPNGIYHYTITTDFPSVPRCFRGTPDASFSSRGPGGDGGNGGQGRPQGRPHGRPPGPPPHGRPPRR